MKRGRVGWIFFNRGRGRGAEWEGEKVAAGFISHVLYFGLMKGQKFHLACFLVKDIREGSQLKRGNGDFYEVGTMIWQYKILLDVIYYFKIIYILKII